jgi:hypothetical protein
MPRHEPELDRILRDRLHAVARGRPDPVSPGSGGLADLPEPMAPASRAAGGALPDADAQPAKGRAVDGVALVSDRRARHRAESWEHLLGPDAGAADGTGDVATPQDRMLDPVPTQSEVPPESRPGADPSDRPTRAAVVWPVLDASATSGSPDPPAARPARRRADPVSRAPGTSSTETPDAEATDLRSPFPGPTDTVAVRPRPPVAEASSDTHDVVRRLRAEALRAEALGGAAAAYAATHGHPLEHPAPDGLPGRQRWHLSTRHAVVAAVATS